LDGKKVVSMEFMRRKSCVCIYGVEIEVKWRLN